MEQIGARAFVFPMHEPEGYPPANDMVIEAATEKEEVKRKIFSELCPVLKPEAIVGTNTSSISITRLAAGTDRPERFIGMHFMNPVPVMKLVEVIRGLATSDETTANVGLIAPAVPSASSGSSATRARRRSPSTGRSWTACGRTRRTTR